MNTSQWLKRSLFGLLCSAAVLQAAAQSFPSKAVNLVVPYPAGGPSDFVARQLQPELNRLLGQPVIIENIGGVGGAIGIQKVLTAPADGYNMTLGTPMELVLAPLAMSAVKFKPDDMKLVAQLVTTTMVLITRKDLPANNVEELIAMAKKPGAKELSYGSVGPGSLYHLIGEKFAQQTGTKMLHVPYKGAAPLMTDLMGGQIDMVFIPLAGSTPAMITEGKVKALGLTTKTAHPRFPNIAPLAAQKGLEGFEFDLWAGIEVPKNTPADVTARLNKAIYEALQNADIRKAYEATGNTVAKPMSPEDLARVYNSETARYQAIAKSINLQPQ
jgi:tripartite-type tricarboxylate transporter receptor subunit TctC